MKTARQRDGERGRSGAAETKQLRRAGVFRSLLLSVSVSLLLLLPAANADDKLWSAVVLASKVSNPKEPPAELREFAPRLKRVFNCNQFEIVGSASKEIDDRKEVWLVPTPHFWFGVKARRATSVETRGGYLLSLQLFQDKRQLVDSETRLAPGSPLFIRGPECEKGQLVFVLQVQR